MALTQLQPFNLNATKSYTFGNVTAVGNVIASNADLGNAATANYFIGNGSQLTGVVTSSNSISSGTSNIFIVSSGGNIAVGVGGTGNVVVFATTGEYVTGLLSVSGNVTSGNLQTDGLLSVNGNITGGNLLINNDATITGNLVVNGNTTFINSNVVTTNDKSITLANNQSTAANVDGAGIDIGNTTIAYWRFNNATTSWQSNVGLTPAANAVLNLGGATNYWGNGYIEAVNANTVSAVGNITGGNLATIGLTSTTDFSITGNVTGHLVPSANGIYSLGSPDQLWSNLYLTGNTISLGTQTLSSNTAAITTSNNFQAANINALYNVTTITLSASGNVIGGNLRTGGLITATGNITGGNVLTGGLISATSNVTAGNLRTGGLITATGNITGGNLLSGGLVSVTGNVTGGNVLTSGYLSVGGNATITGDLSVTGNIIGVLQDHGSDSNNWDAITRMGTYTVNRVSWAGTIGTPLDSQVFVGLLEVLNSSDVAISQVFYPGTIETGNVNIQWNRSNWANSWSPWIKIINNDQIVSGGEF
jgi:filamentous hemagglutinin